MKTISTKELKEKMAQENWSTTSVLFDIRSQGEVDMMPLGEAVHLPMEEMMSRKNEIPKNKDVYLICASGGRSDFACMILEGEGYDNLWSVLGGVMAM